MHGDGPNRSPVDVGDERSCVTRELRSASSCRGVVAEDLARGRANLASASRGPHEAGPHAKMNSDPGGLGWPGQPSSRFICYGAGHGAPRGTASGPRSTDDRAARVLPIADRDRRRAALPSGGLSLTDLDLFGGDQPAGVAPTPIA